jgi:hypothetical protein
MVGPTLPTSTHEHRLSRVARADSGSEVRA